MKPRNEPSKKPATGGRKTASGSKVKAQPLPVPTVAWLMGVAVLVAGLSAYWLMSHRTRAADEFSQGLSLEKQGRTAEAIASFKSALKTNPNDAKACEGLGNMLVESGQVTEALVYLQKAVDLEPANPTAHYNLGTALFKLGRVDDAIAQFQKDLTLNPRDAMAHGNLGNALLAKNRVEEALDHFSRAVALIPTNALAHAAYGNALLQKGELDHAMNEFQFALKIQPRFPLAKSRLLTVASIWASHPVKGFRNGILALKLGLELKKEFGNDDAEVAATLAAAYAEVGDFTQAVALASDAQRLATSQSNSDLAAKASEELDAFRNEQPYRDLALTNLSVWR